MKIKIVNYSKSEKVTEAFEKEGFEHGVIYRHMTQHDVIDLVHRFAFDEGLDVKLIPRLNNEDPALLAVDTMGFGHRNNNRNAKREKGTQVEYGDKQYSVNEVLPHIDKRYGMKPLTVEFDGDPIKMNSLRLRTFKEKGCTCVTCGLEGTYFLKTRGHPVDRWHFNLFGDLTTIVEGEEVVTKVLLTKDHIYPKSKGGPNSIDNMQTMCVTCNGLKGCKVE
jgi:hypothetical protein